MRVHFSEWEITEDEAKTLAEIFLNALDNGIGAATVGTLVVAILDQGAWCVGVTLNVICGTDRSF